MFCLAIEFLGVSKHTSRTLSAWWLSWCVLQISSAFLFGVNSVDILLVTARWTPPFKQAVMDSIYEPVNVPLNWTWQHMLSPVSIMEQTDSSLNVFPGLLVKATRSTWRIFRRTISSEMESLASNLQWVAATANRCIAWETFGESLSIGCLKASSG